MNENLSTKNLVNQRLKAKGTPSFFLFRNGELVAEEGSVDGELVSEDQLRSTLDGCMPSEEKP